MYAYACALDKRRRERKKEKDIAVLLTEESFFKIFGGDLSIPLCENFTIYSVFHALSNDVLFINSARDQKFRIS